MYKHCRHKLTKISAFKKWEKSYGNSTSTINPLDQRADSKKSSNTDDVDFFTIGNAFANDNNDTFGTITATSNEMSMYSNDRTYHTSTTSNVATGTMIHHHHHHYYYHHHKYHQRRLHLTHLIIMLILELILSSNSQQTLYS
jgi:hypothetical protein